MSEKMMSPKVLRPKRTSAKSYASRVFQESSVGMVSTVASTASLRRKIFKVLALVLCLTGFLCQTGQFLEVAFHYPTTVDIDVRRPDSFEVPAYTFCDENGINRRIFCNKYPDRCEEPSEELCKKYESYCGENRTLVPKKEYYNYHQHASRKEIVELNPEVDDFAFAWRSYEEITGPHFRKKDFQLRIPYFMCYTLNDRVNNSLDPVNFTQDKLRNEPVESFYFKVYADEMFLPRNRAGIVFALHSPFRAVNPFQSGIFLRPGRTYIIYISMEEEILQKEPYDTDCVNYTEIWERHGRSGPRMQEMCTHDCLSDISLQCYNCVAPFILFPRKERLCEELRDENCPENVVHEIDQCFVKCRDDCRRTKYRYTVQERFGAHFDVHGNLKDDTDHTIEVEIFIEDNEIIIYKHNPKYMIVEIFSSIGGFIGCWLGISLLDITDIIEGFFRIIWYSLKRRCSFWMPIRLSRLLN